MSALLRTNMGRTSQYRSDGHGRDFYILQDNGGFYKQTAVSPTNRSLIQDYSPARTIRAARKATYVPDGSGRDSYISSFDSARNSFPNNLRHQSPPLMINFADPYFEAHAKWMQNRLKKVSPRRNNALVERLSVPKKFSQL